MLVLARRCDESIHIGEDIVVTILAIDGEKVKIGISAPRDVTILRQEIFEAVKVQDQLQFLLSSRPEPESFQNLRNLLASPENGELPPIPIQPGVEMPAPRESD